MDAVIAAASRATAGLLGLTRGPRLSILIFHRVHRQADPLFPREPDAVRFDRLMGLVARAYRVVTLGEAVAHLARGTLPPRSLVVTFDDGYADNAEVALPILQRWGLKATFFVATGFLDGGRMWNDTVIECLRQCRKDSVDFAPLGLGTHSLAGRDGRQAAILAVLGKIKYLTLVEREAALTTLLRLCGVRDLPRNLMMASRQVAELHRAGMEIGAHTMMHPILARTSEDEAEREIVGGRQRLESLIDAPVEVFAYPNGKPGVDYHGGHAALVRRLGFRGAVSTAAGVSRVGDDLYQLPRFTPWDRSTGRWAARLLLNLRRTDFERAGLGTPYNEGEQAAS